MKIFHHLLGIIALCVLTCCLTFAAALLCRCIVAAWRAGWTILLLLLVLSLEPSAFGQWTTNVGTNVAGGSGYTGTTPATNAGNYAFKTNTFGTNATGSYGFKTNTFGTNATGSYGFKTNTFGTNAVSGYSPTAIKPGTNAISIFGFNTNGVGTNRTFGSGYDTNVPGTARYYTVVSTNFAFTTNTDYIVSLAGTLVDNGIYYPDASQTGAIGMVPGTAVFVGFTNAAGRMLQNTQIGGLIGISGSDDYLGYPFPNGGWALGGHGGILPLPTLMASTVITTNLVSVTNTIARF